jgi:cell fate regulator YaaT (PSP1 superfamily)
MSDEDKDLILDGEDLSEEDAVEQPEAPPGADSEASVNQPPASAEPVSPGDRPVWRVKVLYSSAIEYCDAPPGMELSAGASVVVPTRYGNELGKVLGQETEALAPGQEKRSVLRIAGPADLSRAGENDMREERAHVVCREKIEARGLDMKLVSAHYLLDEQKILFLFTAENRVDFRELVKDLVASFKMRIELRQIGVRDEARVVGGLGICGRALCCNAVTDRLRPVSIKMAKEQNLTLNSMKISGPCGRLLCCLSYEFDVYKEARHALPTMGTRVRFEDEEFRVTDLNVLARRVRFQSESGRVLDMGFDSLSRNPATQAWEIHAKAAAAPSTPAPDPAGKQ